MKIKKISRIVACWKKRNEDIKMNQVPF